MIDIHNHGIYQVDDGADSLKESVEMLLDAKKQGVKAIIFTPHYHREKFQYPIKEIVEHFKKLKPYAEKIGIHISLGCEYHVDSSIVEYLQAKRVASLAGGEYVLTEYEYESTYEEVYQMTKKLIFSGYEPVIAHIERYQCFQRKPQLAEELQKLGAIIQINADSVLGLDGIQAKKTCKKMLKNRWADIVASDAHGMKKRSNHMAECKKKILQRYGEEYTKQLFEVNPRKLYE